MGASSFHDDIAAITEAFAEMEGELKVGDMVWKSSGDYNIHGEVRAVFTTRSGKVRYVVEHKAEGGGSFCHIYSRSNLSRL